MENLLVEQKNSFNFLLKKMPKNIINSNNHIDLSNIKSLTNEEVSLFFNEVVKND